MELMYSRCGDYLYPNFVLETEKVRHIDKYGLRRKAYLKQHKSGWYTTMLLTGKLDQHLSEIDEAANQRFDMIVAQLAAQFPAPDKETNQLG